MQKPKQGCTKPSTRPESHPAHDGHSWSRGKVLELF